MKDYDNGGSDGDVLAGVRFQEDMERKAAIMGGGNCVVPVQRAVDFISKKESKGASLPKSSYRLGVKSARLDNIYPKEITDSICSALIDFEKQLPGFLCEEALLHGVETRSSSPLRVERNPKTCESVNTQGLFIAGEGGGFAGGIVSAAVDGIKVAEAIESVVGE